MRSSSGGCEANSSIQPLPPPAILKLASAPARRIHQLLGRHQPPERRDHVVAAGQLRAAVVGAELALAREPGHDHREMPSATSSSIVITHWIM